MADEVTSAVIVAGLGNPGKQYQGTRHNIGFDVVEKIAESLSGCSADWRQEKVADTLNLTFEAKKIILIKPQTYMNRSGEVLRAVLSYYKIPPKNLIVIHDELDLPFGTIRLKMGGGEAGHNGLKSISQELGTQDYQRIRIGIGKPIDQRIDSADWVLAKFGAEEQQILPEIISRAAEQAIQQIKKL